MPDYAQHFVKPNLGPVCLQKLSADDTGSKELTLKVTILLEYHVLFVIFDKVAKFEIVVCCKL